MTNTKTLKNIFQYLLLVFVIFFTFHVSLVTYADQDQLSGIEKDITQNKSFAGEKCPQDLMISDLMKEGDLNGEYSSYNKGVVTEVSILQAHINRLLHDDYVSNATISVDRWFGAETKLGVQRLQKKINQLFPSLTPLDVDGIVGDKTRLAINMSCTESMLITETETDKEVSLVETISPENTSTHTKKSFLKNITRRRTSSGSRSSDPVITGPTFITPPQVVVSSYNTLVISAALDVPGNMYCVLQHQGEIAPTATEVFNGQAASGSTLIWSGDLQGMNMSGSITVEHDLQTNPNYALYCIAEDSTTLEKQSIPYHLAFSGLGFVPSDKIVLADSPGTVHANTMIATFEDEYGSSITSRLEIVPRGAERGLRKAAEIGATLVFNSFANMPSEIIPAEGKWSEIALFMPMGANNSVLLSNPSNIPVIITSCAGNTQCETGYGPGLEFWDEDDVLDSAYLSSFSNARIAAKLLKIKEALNASWWEARYRARITAIRTISTHPLGEDWNENHGYGQIDVAAAIGYVGTIPTDPYE